MELEFIGIKDLARLLDVSVDTIYGWVFERKIPYYKFSRLVKFNRQEIEEWLKAKKVENRY